MTLPSTDRLALVTTAVALGLVTLFAFQDHFVIFGDSVVSLAGGRTIPVPVWGDWIAARVVGDFFPAPLFRAYAALVGPLFGIEHVADVYASFMAFCFALYFMAMAGAAFQFVRVLVPLRGWVFLPFALAFFLLYFAHRAPVNIMLFFTYDVPMMLAAWFVLPFFRVTITGEDPLGRLGTAGALSLLAVGAYFIAFSITNVYVMTCMFLAFCSLAWFLRPGEGDRTTWPERLQALPAWVLPGVVGTFALTFTALLFDLTSGRLVAERQGRWANLEESSVELGAALRDLLPPVPSALLLLILAPFAVYAMALLVPNLAARVSASGVYREHRRGLFVLAGTLVGYAAFLAAMTVVFERNYLVYGGFPKPIHFLLAVILMTPLFFFGAKRWLGPVLVPLCIVLALSGGHRLLLTPPSFTNNWASMEQARGIYSAMYMSYCNASDTVPVFLKRPRYSFVPIPREYERNWFGKAFSQVFARYVIRDERVRYLPSFYAVDSAGALRAELRKQAAAGKSRCLDPENSPYFIDFSASP